jgi:4-hydroxy-2-oxoheptanedioate aldolase
VSANPSVGGWCHVDSGYTAEIMGAAGFDWCCLDMQHGAITRHDLVPGVQALAAAGCAVVVRVAANAHDQIAVALDAGAGHVIVPQVSSAAEARRAVAACRYPPAGHRSWGPLRAKLRATRPEPAVLDAEARCLVMVEDREALDDLAAIADVDGLAGIFVGPADLALSLWGDPYRANDPRTVAVAAGVADACRRRGLVAAVHCGGTEHVGTWRAAGFTMLAVDSDSALLISAARRAATDARRALEP